MQAASLIRREMEKVQGLKQDFFFLLVIQSLDNLAIIGVVSAECKEVLDECQHLQVHSHGPLQGNSRVALKGLENLRDLFVSEDHEINR